MDFLLNPNVAYLFLVGGVLLAMLSLAAPGTGFFEVGAFFSLVLGVYVIYAMEKTPVWWALILLASSVVPFVYAIQKPKRELYLGLSILLLVVGSVFMFPRTNGQPGVNPIVATVASVLVAGFLWIAITKYTQVAHTRPSHDIDGLVGQVGEAKTRIHDEGSVQVAGELWSARSEKAIPAGSSVRVLRREGFVLIVEKNS
jgi:membrane-bound serine protease (ClpP class)